MYTSFRVQNFRCFKDLQIKDLAHVNLIAGKNNVGKTALLEALLCENEVPSFERMFTMLDEMRGRFPMYEGPSRLVRRPGSERPPWEDMFHLFNTSLEIRLERIETGQFANSRYVRLAQEQGIPPRLNVYRGGPDEKGSRSEPDRWVEWDGEQLKDDGKRGPLLHPFFMWTPMYFRSARFRYSLEEVELYSSIEKEGLESSVFDILKIVEPRLRRLAMIVDRGIPLLHGDLGIKRLVPLTLMGEGVVGLVQIALCVANAGGGIVLVDEIENGIHHSVMADVWKAVGEAARAFNVQVFATTHSYECIMAAHRAFSESERYDFALHRLDRIEDDIAAVTYDQETLEAALELEWEVR